MKRQSSFLIATLLAASLPAHAVTIAVVDSGTDLKHPMLVNNQWTNLKDEDDAVDNDDNGFIDDTHGWNFAEQNEQLFDKRFLGTFAKDVYLFFEIQTKMLNGTATEADIAWMKAKREDAAFIASLQTFGNFAHGSHVAGIVAKDSVGAKIMPLKLIATKRPKPFAEIERNGMVAFATKTKNEDKKKKLVLMALDFLGKQQSAAFGPIAAYLKAQEARVANCSFGTSYANVKVMFKPLLEKIFKRELPEAELHEYILHFMNANLSSSADAFIHAAPNTLFVIAAGNDGSNNDQFPASPANIKANNSITVAATNGFDKIASFSNFGEKMVDVAAPGVGITSAAPGGEIVMMSGTSQAAPFVANVAGQILDINPSLTTSEVKEILMGTSDFKDFLKGKVRSSGIVNTERAKKGAKLSLTLSIREAIAKAIVEVRDQVETGTRADSSSEEAALVLPLPSTF